jgi:hypothetical protein
MRAQSLESFCKSLAAEELVIYAEENGGCAGKELVN